MLLAVREQLPDLVLEVSYFLVFLEADLGQELNVLVGLAQLPLKIGDLALDLSNLDDLGVDVLGGQVGNETCLGSVVKSTYVFVDVPVTWGQARHHQGVGIAAQTLLEQLGQLRLSVRNELVVLLVGVSESSYDFPQHVQTLVDVNALLRLQPCGSCLALLLRTCEVHQLQTADRHVHRVFYVLSFDRERKDAVTSA